MEAAADEARKKEADEIARRERELAELDAKVKEMRKKLGTQAVRTDDSLDSMLAMVQQKEQQEKKLQELRRQREEEERKRQTEIARLKRERGKDHCDACSRSSKVQKDCGIKIWTKHEV
jgi:hypothetical protein